MENQTTYVIKRNGRRVEFSAYKIREAIRKAFLSQQPSSIDSVFDQLTKDTVQAVQLFYSNDNPPTVENIQDIVEKVIIKHNYAEVAKAFIIYRERHKLKREQAVLNKNQNPQAPH